MTQAFRESPAQTNGEVKNLEARLAIESQRCLLLEQQMLAFREDAVHTAGLIRDLEARLAEGLARVRQMEQQVQSLHEWMVRAAASGGRDALPTLQLMPEIGSKVSRPSRKKG